MKSLKNSNNINFNSLNNNFKATEKKSTFNISNKSYKERKKYILNKNIPSSLNVRSEMLAKNITLSNRQNHSLNKEKNNSLIKNKINNSISILNKFKKIYPYQKSDKSPKNVNLSNSNLT